VAGVSVSGDTSLRIGISESAFSSEIEQNELVLCPSYEP
jgi:hypothetical protein